MDVVFDLRCTIYYIDTAIVTPFFPTPGSLGQPAPAEEMKKFGRYHRINLVPFVLETTGRSACPKIHQIPVQRCRVPTGRCP